MPDVAGATINYTGGSTTADGNGTIHLVFYPDGLAL